jgi:tRNA(Ile2) C34 agmatinyltransferase TiaS
MTPRGRANALYYGGLALCAAGGLALGIERVHPSDSLFAIGAALIVGFVALAAFSLASSRCPHCRRYIDLRGRSAYCPRCGKWIPSREGDLPSVG